MSNGRPDEPRPADAGIDQAWRAASTEFPGPRIDAAILDAARAEVDRDQRRPVGAGGAASPRRPNRWTTWQPLAAAATVAGLAFVLLQTLPRERDVAPPIAVEQARPEEAAPAEAELPPADESRAPAGSIPAPQATDRGAARHEAAPGNTSARAAEAPAAPLAAPLAAPPVAASAESRDQQPSRSRASAPAPAPATAGIAAQAEHALGESQHAMKSATSGLAPDAWAARIEQLLAAGDQQAAEAELRAFRAAHADADQYLPDGLRHWAGTVQ